MEGLMLSWDSLRIIDEHLLYPAGWLRTEKVRKNWPEKVNEEKKIPIRLLFDPLWPGFSTSLRI